MRFTIMPDQTSPRTYSQGCSYIDTNRFAKRVFCDAYRWPIRSITNYCSPQFTTKQSMLYHRMHNCFRYRCRRCTAGLVSMSSCTSLFSVTRITVYFHSIYRFISACGDTPSGLPAKIGQKGSEPRQRMATLLTGTRSDSLRGRRTTHAKCYLHP